MTNLKPFRFKTARPAKTKITDVHRVQPVDVKETFTGQIQNLKASDLEERFARALDKRGLKYQFRVPFFAPRGALGEVELDFMVYDGPLSYPFQIDGAFAHASATQKNHDAQQDAILNDYLAKQGGSPPVQRIPASQLTDQNAADKLVREKI